MNPVISAIFHCVVGCNAGATDGQTLHILKCNSATGEMELVQTVKGMAKDIHDKYICPPETTNFAVMFLPVEGLYAEVVKLGLVEDLRSKYNVTVAGPTTMAALLNSLQMGFQTLAIQKKLNGASNDLDTLLGVRTRAIDRSLRNVTASAESSKLLGIAEDVATDE